MPPITFRASRGSAKNGEKLIAEYGSIEGLLAATDQLKGKLQENVRAHTRTSPASKQLVTIDRHVPLEQVISGASGRVETAHEPSPSQRKALPRTARTGEPRRRSLALPLRPIGIQCPGQTPLRRRASKQAGGHLQALAPGDTPIPAGPAQPALQKTIEDTRHHYTHTSSPEMREGRARLNRTDEGGARVLLRCGDVGARHLKVPHLIGLAISWEKGTGRYVQIPPSTEAALAILGEFREVFESRVTGRDAATI